MPACIQQLSPTSGVEPATVGFSFPIAAARSLSAASTFQKVHRSLHSLPPDILAADEALEIARSPRDEPSNSKPHRDPDEGKKLHHGRFGDRRADRPPGGRVEAPPRDERRAT